jgi:hypothetical protein
VVADGSWPSPLRPLPDGLERGVTLAVDGIAGQRASAKGRLDGYRIWVRDGGDLQVLAPAPTASPSGTADPSASPAVVTIAVARTRVGTRAAVEGTVTSQGGLLDADGRRVTIQDGTAGILIRLAARETAPAVGSRVRVVGSVGTYYGAPQLSASAPAERLGSATVSPASVTKAPRAGVEWQLVRVKGTVVDVKRTGQSWRAELALAGGARVPIVGLARAGIRVDRIRRVSKAPSWARPARLSSAMTSDLRCCHDADHLATATSTAGQPRVLVGLRRPPTLNRLAACRRRSAPHLEAMPPLRRRRSRPPELLANIGRPSASVAWSCACRTRHRGGRPDPRHR